MIELFWFSSFLIHSNVVMLVLLWGFFTCLWGHGIISLKMNTLYGTSMVLFVTMQIWLQNFVISILYMFAFFLGLQIGWLYLITMEAKSPNINRLWTVYAYHFVAIIAFIHYSIWLYNSPSILFTVVNIIVKPYLEIGNNIFAIDGGRTLTFSRGWRD